jgi:hypothetical protein
MRKQIRYPFILQLLCAGFFLVPASSTLAQEAVIADDNQKDYVSGILPLNIEDAHTRIELLFNSDDRDYYEDYSSKIYDLPANVTNAKDLQPDLYKKFLKFPLVLPSKFYVFYGAYDNMQHTLNDFTPFAVMGHSNAALQRYAKLPLEQREQDIYLWSPDTPYWHSQYTLNNKAVPFRSYFIIHLAAIDDAHTSVEIIEDQPVVQLGRKMSVDDHGTVHHYDIREVEPTTQDREFLLSCIRQFIDRKVPGRHWFNCKTQAELDAPPPVPFTVP